MNLNPNDHDYIRLGGLLQLRAEILRYLTGISLTREDESSYMTYVFIRITKLTTTTTATTNATRLAAASVQRMHSFFIRVGALHGSGHAHCSHDTSQPEPVLSSSLLAITRS